jgi:hypothetical protein
MDRREATRYVIRGLCTRAVFWHEDGQCHGAQYGAPLVDI